MSLILGGAGFRICISFHADPDPGSQKCRNGSGSGPLIFYSDPDPKVVKIKEDNLYQQIFNYIFLNDIKTPLKISIHKVLQKDPYLYVSSSIFTLSPCIFRRLFSSWIWIRIQTAYLYADPDPKHWGVGQRIPRPAPPTCTCGIGTFSTGK